MRQCVRKSELLTRVQIIFLNYSFRIVFASSVRAETLSQTPEILSSINWNWNDFWYFCNKLETNDGFLFECFRKFAGLIKNKSGTFHSVRTLTLKMKFQNEIDVGVKSYQRGTEKFSFLTNQVYRIGREQISKCYIQPNKIFCQSNF
jgi:hypothetical protein